MRLKKLMEIMFEFDGRSVKAQEGQTIAEALLTNGITTVRKTRNGADRGVYCAMGVCYECRAIVNGTPNTRTCMTTVTQGCKVTTQEDAGIEVADEQC
jgi:predicted molibdopterin-dependent oxidoreductase YjgC